MMKPYYDTLGLRKDASDEQIANSYKKMVLRWHPRFAKQDQKTAYYHFSEISEAYEVLSDPLKRSFYDKHGYLKLKEGLFAEGQLKGGYRFAGNPDEIFQKFFHSNNSLATQVHNQVHERGSIFSHAFGGLNYKVEHVLQDLVVEVNCTLNELYKGVAKRVDFKRRILNLDGRTTSLREESRLLEIKAGYGGDTQLVFVREGHENIDRKASNLIFKIKEIAHHQIQRKGNDLIYLTDVALVDALDSKTVAVITLDNRVLRIPIDQIITPKVLKWVEAEGMPIVASKAKGSLYIRFNIIFPKQIAEDKKATLRKLLS